MKDNCKQLYSELKKALQKLADSGHSSCFLEEDLIPSIEINKPLPEEIIQYCKDITEMSNHLKTRRSPDRKPFKKELLFDEVLKIVSEINKFFDETLHKPQTCSI
ncbi:MAG: hypothetical protein PVG30_08535 [Gammaproteobacteria bacterium]|jgi:hypothetical protein